MESSMLKPFSDAGLPLASHLFAKDNNKNFVFSPPSINVLLSMLALGSKGETLDELLSFLNSKNLVELNECVNEIVSELLADGTGEYGPKLAITNAVWVDQRFKIKEPFEQVVNRVHKADVKPVDFQTKSEEVRNEVNSWAEEKTEGLIKNLIPQGSVSDMTQLILTNSIYFKASWPEPFNALRTKDHPFRLLSGEYVNAPFMTNSAFHYVSKFDGFKVLRLPYENDRRRFSMCIFLPDADDGVTALAGKLGLGSNFLDDHIPKKNARVGKFLIPKFKISYEFKAAKILKKLGLGLANGLTEIADCSTGEKLVISNIHHKAFISVNEEGTEAAAATDGECDTGFYFPDNEPIDFVADHPFFFVIREDVTGFVLFVGQVINPLKD